MMMEAGSGIITLAQGKDPNAMAVISTDFRSQERGQDASAASGGEATDSPKNTIPNKKAPLAKANATKLASGAIKE